ncbi:type II secretion system protein GspD [Methylotenera sp. G11]|uniref:type II secretion system protein GspD n=1 Tax=Methylotenera sp. G11 TaxID=1506585 RepID=UPI000A7978DE|nr:secretin N-terminal domain-containing protein [Methylotenera sp. G11]
MAINKVILMLSMSVVLGVSACAHQSKVQPSKGHIDDKSSSAAVEPSKSAGNAAASGIPKPVTDHVYLPPPQPKAKEPVYSIVVYDTPVKEVLFAIARDSKFNVDIHPSIRGRVTLNAVDQTLPAILERISRQVDLTYKIQGNVLTIAPDQPVLRTYKIDYVNMSRDTRGFIGVDGQISSTSQSSSGTAGTVAGSTGTTTSTSGNGASNSSRTSITSESKGRFWETLENNIKDILEETDKEVMIARSGSGGSLSAGAEKSESSAKDPATQVNSQKVERAEFREEYKTLFAATVISNREAGVISVRGTSKQHEKVQEFLDKVLNSAKRQVLIEATIVEVKLNDGFQAGIDWSRLNNNRDTNSGFEVSGSLGPLIPMVGATGPGFVAGYLNPLSRIGNIAASISLLKQFGTTKVLSSPKLMVLNNQTAVLKVVDNLVYFTVQVQDSLVANAGSSKTITTTPNTVPVGVVMSVTPQISDAGMVNVNVRPTISSLIQYIPDPNPSLYGSDGKPFTTYKGIPEIRIREMESLLQINSGNIAVLGGLMQDEIKSNKDKVPGVSDVPGIGKIFTGQNDSNTKTELVVFLRPTVITTASLESDELANFKQFLPSQQLQKTLDENGER